MIKVKCEYEILKRKTGSVHFYHLLEVTGHATPIENYEHLKVCASVTTIVSGFCNMFATYECVTKLDRGYFFTIFNKTIWEPRYQIALDTLVYQLWFLYSNYPQYFDSFEFIDKGGK